MMGYDFVAIDFETANGDRSSACALGVVVVKNLEIVEKKSWLIRPKELYFDPWNIAIHGIDEEDIINEPEFNELWDTFRNYLEGNIIVAHNASFDISVLRHVLDKYDIPYPSFSYLCTMNIARKTWPGLINYRLDTVAEYLDIKFNHHNPREDAVACAKIIQNSVYCFNAKSLDELIANLEVKPGKLFCRGYKPCSIAKPSTSNTYKLKSISSTTNNFDPNHSFYGKKVIFTGTLHTMVRKDAMQKVVNVGGLIGNTVATDTNYLVVGEQDYRRLRGKNMSNKMKQAIKLIKEGQEIEIITEDDFLRLL